MISHKGLEGRFYGLFQCIHQNFTWENSKNTEISCGYGRPGGWTTNLFKLVSIETIFLFTHVGIIPTIDSVKNGFKAHI